MKLIPLLTSHRKPKPSSGLVSKPKNIQTHALTAPGAVVKFVNINIATSSALGKLSGQDSLHKRNDRPTRLTLDSSGLPYFGHPPTPEAAAEVWLRIAASDLET